MCMMVLSAAFCTAVVGPNLVHQEAQRGLEGSLGISGASKTHTFRLRVLDGMVLPVSWLKMSVVKETVPLMVCLYGLTFMF